MKLSRQALPLAVLALLLCLASAAEAATPRGDWPTWGNSTLRNGVATLSRVNAANTPELALAWTRPLDGVVTAQPLFISDPSGGTYITATAAGTVTAFTATNGTVRWRASLGSQTTRCSQLPKDIFGITGTPVYDRSTNTIYAATHGVLYGLDAATGIPRPGYPQILPMDPFHEHVWGALSLRAGALYIGTAAFCDVQPWKGRLIRVDLVSHATSEWDAVPTPGVNGGGGLFGWGGVSIDPKTGNVWAATANAVGPDVADDSAFDAESIVQLSPILQKLQSSHAPGMPLHGDYGFGSTPMLFTPTGCPALAAAEAKNGSVYIWQQAKLSIPPQRLQVAFPATLFGLPAWDPRSQTMFVTTTNGYNGYASGLLAFRMNASCKMRLAWHQGLGSLLDSVPTVVNDTVMVGTGTGKVRIFKTSDGTSLATLPAGGATFAPPISIGNDVVVASYGKKISVFRVTP
jgi:outer membrane protein assembly factor BamB